MANRARDYMDRIFGRNEGRDSRDFSEGRGYRDDYYRDRPRRFKSDYERDYNVRRNMRPQSDYMDYNPNGATRGFDYNVRERDDDESMWNEDFNSERDRGFGRRFDRNDSFAPGDFRNTEFGNASMRREGKSGIFQNRGRFFGKGPKGWKRSDERIKDEVSEALYRDYEIDASEIEVEVKDGIVTLSGTVDSRDSKRSAEECIENLSGVIDVHNRLRIEDNSNISNLRSTDQNDKRALS